MRWVDDMHRDLDIAELQDLFRRHPATFWQALAQEHRTLLGPLLARMRDRLAAK